MLSRAETSTIGAVMFDFFPLRQPSAASSKTTYALLAERLATLGVDEYFDLPDFPRVEREVQKMRNAIPATIIGRHLRFKVRMLPSGGVRVIRTGTHGSSFLGIVDLKSETNHPVLVFRRAAPVTGLRPGAFFLGFLWGTNAPKGIARNLPCQVKACAFPGRLENSNGLCRYHSRFFDKASRMRGALDKRDLRATEENPEPTFTTGQLWEDQYNWRNIRFEHKSRSAARREKMSDDYWRTVVEPSETRRKT